MEKSLPEMIKEYLETKYRENPYSHLINREHIPTIYPVTYGIHVHAEGEESGGRSLEGKKLRWNISISHSNPCMAVEEDEDGKVWVLSGGVDYIRDVLYDHVGKKAYDIMLELRDRKNWKKYEKKFWEPMARLAWNDEIARRINVKTGIKTVHQIGLPKNYDSKIEGIFYAVMNLKDVSDPIKFLFITKMIDAIDEAFRLGLFPEWFAYEEYKDFVKKYAPKGKGRKG